MGCGRFLPCLLSVLPSSVWIIFSRPPLAFLCSYNSLSANSFQPIFPLTFKHFSVSPFGNVYFWDPRNQPGSLRPTEVRASLPRGRPGPDCAAERGAYPGCGLRSESPRPDLCPGADAKRTQVSFWIIITFLLTLAPRRALEIDPRGHILAFLLELSNNL